MSFSYLPRYWRTFVPEPRSSHRTKALFLNSEIDPSLPERLYGDEKRLQQIIINLVGNAIKFTQRAAVSRSACMLSILHVG